MATRSKNAALLTVVFGIILFFGVGMLCRPLVKPRPQRDSSGAIMHDASGATVYVPGSVESISTAQRPYDIAQISGLVVIGVGLVLFARSRHERKTPD